MKTIIGFVVIVLAAASLLSLLAFIFIILCQFDDWMEDNKIIAKWLDKVFKAGEQK